MMRRMNGKLVPFAVLALYALMTFNGQEKPKQTNMTVSKIEPIMKPPFEDSIAPTPRMNNFMKNRNINLLGKLFFLLSKVFLKNKEVEFENDS